jgi:serine protease AprX
MDPLRLLDLLLALDGRPLHRDPSIPLQAWSGIFEGVVHVSAPRILDDDVLVTITFPTASSEVWDFISADEAAAGQSDKVRITQSGSPITLRGLTIARTGSAAPATLSGPPGYIMRVAARHTEDDSGEPLVLELHGSAQELIASAVGLLPVREDLTAVMTTSVLSRPLLELLQHASPQEQFDVVIDVNLEAHKTLDKTLADVLNRVAEVSPDATPEAIEQYVFARMTREAIEQLVRSDQGDQSATGDINDARQHRSIYRVWPDFPVRALLDRSVPTIKADAARAAFAASGRGITWAVVDSGIEKDHPHFDRHHNLQLDDADIAHQDFVRALSGCEALLDPYGHGTHVAGIIAGEQAEGATALAGVRERDERGNVSVKHREVTGLRGVAPECKLISLRVLDERGYSPMKRIMQAIAYINQVNKYGRDLRIEGVNLSVGYDFNAEWFACGQSPVCIEVDRLVATGVVVVVAAGNTGWEFATQERPIANGMDVTINDPGNAARAITVGSTHGQAPHTYGVSFFSSKGPTGDGRLKPDLVAPGERIVSCATGRTGQLNGDANPGELQYVEDSGTSMAAPHVSGAAAAFLSIRREFIGQPERVKELLMRTATDLGRERSFQGSGLLDLMRAIQAI